MSEDGETCQNGRGFWLTQPKKSAVGVQEQADAPPSMLTFTWSIRIFRWIYISRPQGKMKERSKERLAALLMEELLEQLAERDNIKRMFADMTSAPMEELLESLLDEFERIIEKHHLLILDAKKVAREKRG